MSSLKHLYKSGAFFVPGFISENPNIPLEHTPGIPKLPQMIQEFRNINRFCWWSSRVFSFRGMLYGGFLKWWVSPTNPWVFLLKNDQHLGCEMGVPPFKETPISWRFNMPKTSNTLRFQSVDGNL